MSWRLREAEIASCFSCDVEFHYSEGLEKFNDLLQDFKAHFNTKCSYSSDEEDIVNSRFGKKSNHDRVIAMVDVSSLADKFKKFESFLSVAHKFIAVARVPVPATIILKFTVPVVFKIRISKAYR